MLATLGVDADVVDGEMDASTCVVVVRTTDHQHQQQRDEPQQQRRQVDAVMERIETERLRAGCSEFHNFQSVRVIPQHITRVCCGYTAQLSRISHCAREAIIVHA